MRPLIFDGSPQGLHGLETLLNDHMDSALDKLTSWALRNTFEIPDDLRLTLVSRCESVGSRY